MTQLIRRIFPKDADAVRTRRVRANLHILIPDTDGGSGRYGGLFSVRRSEDAQTGELRRLCDFRNTKEMPDIVFAPSRQEVFT